MLEIQIVADASYNREEGKRFTEGIQTRIGENMHIDIKLVNEIERPLNQKRRFIKSDISNEFIQKTKSKEEVR
jgi:phenylacetate-CoA ligase